MRFEKPEHHRESVTSGGVEQVFAGEAVDLAFEFVVESLVFCLGVERELRDVIEVTSDGPGDDCEIAVEVSGVSGETFSGVGEEESVFAAVVSGDGFAACAAGDCVVSFVRDAGGFDESCRGGVDGCE